MVLPDSDIAETMTLKLGLKFARDMLFLNLRPDSLNTITALRDQHHGQSYIGLILDDGKLLFSSFHSYDLVHVRRVANQAVHYLAKFAISNPDCVWI